MLIHTETCEGFEINALAMPEGDDPSGHFASGDDAADAEIVRQIRDGELAWFQVEVRAIREGVTLGRAHLGGCCYDSESDFVRESGGYYEDLRAEAIAQARDKIRALCASVEG